VSDTADALKGVEEKTAALTKHVILLAGIEAVAIVGEEEETVGEEMTAGEAGEDSRRDVAMGFHNRSKIIKPRHTPIHLKTLEEWDMVRHHHHRRSTRITPQTTTTITKDLPLSTRLKMRITLLLHINPSIRTNITYLRTHHSHSNNNHPTL
jgi:hypothetical protein